MRNNLSLPIILSLLLGACGGGANNDDGNPNANQQSVNLTTSRLGASGGFIDVNADGYADVIIGAPEATISVNKTGVALLFLGTENGLSTNVSAALSGESKGDYFGFSYANVGDVNDDGNNDFAIGAINAEGDAGISGAVYVYAGGSESNESPKMILKLNGQEAFDKFGYAITGGDVNGDGVNDILVSSPYTFTEDFQSGSVNVYFGGKNIDNTADIVIKGDKVNASVGLAIATGDVNGDGIDDILMDGHSKVFIYYGGSDLKANIEADPTPNVQIRSDTSRFGGSGFGWSIAYAGDVDGDGFGDIAIGNPRRSVPSTSDNRGSFYIFKGGKDLPAEIFEDNKDYRIVKIIGAQVNDHFGNSIAVVGDLNSGAAPDFLVGANWADSGTEEDQRITGNVYLFKGVDLLVDDSLVALDVSAASKNYPTEQTSAEFGKFITSNQETLLSGVSGAEKHNGGYILKNINSGGSEKSFSADDSASIVAGAEDHSGH